MLTLFTVAAMAAATPAMLPSTTVRHADLDLSTEHGRAQLDRRIVRAAQLVCRPESRLTPQMVTEAKRCTEATVAATRSYRDRVIAQRSGLPVAIVAR